MDLSAYITIEVLISSFLSLLIFWAFGSWIFKVNKAMTKLDEIARLLKKIAGEEGDNHSSDK